MSQYAEVILDQLHISEGVLWRHLIVACMLFILTRILYLAPMLQRMANNASLAGVNEIIKYLSDPDWRTLDCPRVHWRTYDCPRVHWLS